MDPALRIQLEQGAITDKRVLQVLGRGLSWLSIGASSSLALLCFFYVYTIGSLAGVIIYPLVDRVTFETTFELFVVNEFVDQIIIGSLFLFWLIISMRRSKASTVGIGILGTIFAVAAVAGIDLALDGISIAALPAAVCLIFFDRYFVGDRKILGNQSGLMPNYLAIIGISLGLIALVFSIASVVFSHPLVEGTTPIRNYGYEIFLLLSRLSPILLIILISCYPVKLVIDYVSSLRRKAPKQDKLPDSTSTEQNKSVSKSKKVLFLSLFVILSIGIATIPHLPTMNKGDQTVGVDTDQYAIWMNGLRESQDPSDFLSKLFVEESRGDRPVSLFLIYGFQQVIAPISDNLGFRIELLPFMLGPALVLAVYFLTRELTRNDSAPLFAAFLTAMSYHVLIGIYAGFYANWIALVFGYLSIAFLFRFLRSHGKRDLAMYGVLATLVLFSHVYTWSIFTIVTGVFLIVTMKFTKKIFVSDKHALLEDPEEKRKRKRSALLLLIVMGSIVGIDIGRTLLTGASSGIEGDLQLGQRMVGADQFALRWNNLTYAAMVYVGGFFANFLILGLGIYWLYRSDMWKMQDIFIIIFLSVGILPFLFGDWVIQTRVFYNIPFQIPAALGLMHFRNQAAGLLRSIPIYMWLIAFAIVAVSNLSFIMPP